METLYDRAFNTKFHRQLAEDYYNLYYHGHDVTPGEVTDAFTPLLKIILVSKFYWVNDELWEDMISEAYVKLLKTISEKRYNPEGGKTFAYLFSTIHNAMHRFASHNMPYKTSISDIPIDEIHKQNPVKDMENQLLLYELPSIIRDSVLKRIRYTGNEYQACRYILNRFLLSKPVVLYTLKNRYSIPDELHKFFIDYVTVNIRVVLFNLKKDIDFEDNEKDYFIPVRGYEEDLIYGGIEDS